MFRRGTTHLLHGTNALLDAIDVLHHVCRRLLCPLSACGVTADVELKLAKLGTRTSKLLLNLKK